MKNGCFEVLIIGAGRGGTSLLAGILDAHSSLEIAFEQFAAGYLMGRKLPPEKASNYYERTATFLAACNATAASFPDLVWGNKITTEQLRALQKHNAIEGQVKIDLLDEFFQKTFHGKKIIFILRDGRSCIISKVNRTGVDIVEACSRWQFSAKVYRYLREHHGDWHIVKYEDLVAKSESTTRGLCDFLQLNFEPNMLLEGPRNPKMRADYQQTHIEQKTSIQALPEEHLDRLRADLEYCGYI